MTCTLGTMHPYPYIIAGSINRTPTVNSRTGENASPNGKAVRLRMKKKNCNISFDLQYIMLYITIKMQYIIKGEPKWIETN